MVNEPYVTPHDYFYGNRTIPTYQDCYDTHVWTSNEDIDRLMVVAPSSRLRTMLATTRRVRHVYPGGRHHEPRADDIYDAANLYMKEQRGEDWGATIVDSSQIEKLINMAIARSDSRFGDAAGIAAMVEEYKQAFFEERLQMFAENGIDLTREENVPEVNPGTGLRRYYTQCQTHKSKAIPGNVANKDRYHLAVVCSK